jgi:hypothetical protein
MSEKKIMLGIIEDDGQLKIDWNREASLPMLISYFGMLTVEVPFLMQHLKAKKAAEEKRVVTPN